jgi:predicted HicB family RNase H-like nuclease
MAKDKIVMVRIDDQMAKKLRRAAASKTLALSSYVRMVLNDELAKIDGIGQKKK